MKKKVISVLLAATMIGGLLAGCGSGNKNDAKTEDGKTKIRFLSAMELVDEDMIEAFEKENPKSVKKVRNQDFVLGFLYDRPGKV